MTRLINTLTILLLALWSCTPPQKKDSTPVTPEKYIAETADVRMRAATLAGGHDGKLRPLQQLRSAIGAPVGIVAAVSIKTIWKRKKQKMAMSNRELFRDYTENPEKHQCLWLEK